MKIYSCFSCGYKSTSSSAFIQGKGGCSSCGKSNLKCPRCGMYIKAKNIKETAHINAGHVETSGQHIKIKRIK